VRWNNENDFRNSFRGERKMNRNEQKELTYKELYNLLSLIPFKYSKTRSEIKSLMDFLNNEEWLLEVVE
tara:strand:- start:671 stop:877 length:207 start_codon:yes stop_codon:yes gene_type:complete